MALTFYLSKRSAIFEYGSMWETISAQVGRAAGDCRDRFRNHIAHKDKRVQGKAFLFFCKVGLFYIAKSMSLLFHCMHSGEWTLEEEAQLTEIVRSLTVDQGKDIMHDIPWNIVAERMGHVRSRQQCRVKWQDSLSKRLKQGHDGETPRWGNSEQFRLVQECVRIDSPP